MNDFGSLARTPKQDRSRASFERVLEAAGELLAERGAEDFTLTEISRRAGASIGSIYARVKGKDDLIRIVQARTLERLDAENERAMDPARWQGLRLPELVPALIAEVSQPALRYAPILRALTLRASTDPVLSQVGKESFGRFESRFKSLLLARRSEIRHPAPERAVASCFTVIWSSLARYLGLGMAGRPLDRVDWEQVSADLGVMCSLFLLSDPEHGAERHGRGSRRIG